MVHFILVKGVCFSGYTFANIFEINISGLCPLMVLRGVDPLPIRLIPRRYVTL